LEDVRPCAPELPTYFQKPVSFHFFLLSYLKEQNKKASRCWLVFYVKDFI
jgi:hypothetical protein